ncbi:MAG: hypothetical protein ACC656_11200 [Candidatus Heimdallarchaeota archaeon]
MEWFDNFKERIKKSKERIKKSLVHDIPTYLDYNQLVILTFPDGHKENGRVKNIEMYKDGWVYFIDSETGKTHILTYKPNKPAKVPIDIQVYNDIDDSYYNIKEVEFNLHES